MKWILLITLFISLSSLFAMDEAAEIFTLISPSTSCISLGEITGVADPWRNDAFASWSNPALSSFHEGFQYGFTSRLIWDDIRLHSSYVSFGYKGLGVSLPAPNANNDLGTTAYYPFDNWFDRGPFDSHESASEYGLSYKVVNNHNASDPNKSFDVSLGISYTHVRSVIKNFYGDFSTVKSESDMVDLGFLALYKIKNVEKLDNGNLQFSLGVKKMNFGEHHIQFGSYLDPLPSNTFIAIGIYSTIPYESMPVFSSNILDAKNSTTSKILIGYSGSGTLENVFSIGLESGFQDCLYGRLSYYDDKEGSVQGWSGGMGLRWHYRNAIEANLNIGWLYAGKAMPYQRSYDYTLSAHF
jgi:hypothetical protein